MLRSCTYDLPCTNREMRFILENPRYHRLKADFNGPKWFKRPTGPNIYVTNSPKYINSWTN